MARKIKLSNEQAIGRRVAREIASLADLTSDPHNARKHTPRNVGVIEDALREVGAARSIVIDEDGVVLAGNATIDAAAAAFGDAPVRVIDANGSEIIAVRRTGLTAQQKKRLALYDNRAAELAEWDASAFDSFTADDVAGMFTAAEVDAIMSAGGEPQFVPEGADDQGHLDEKVPATPVECPACGHEFTP